MNKPSVALIYTRQSVSQFDADGHAQGPSLDQQQLDAVKSRPEFKGLTVEHAAGSGSQVMAIIGWLVISKSRGSPVASGVEVHLITGSRRGAIALARCGIQ